MIRQIADDRDVPRIKTDFLACLAQRRRTWTLESFERPPGNEICPAWLLSSTARRVSSTVSSGARSTSGTSTAAATSDAGSKSFERMRLSRDKREAAILGRVAWLAPARRFGDASLPVNHRGQSTQPPRRRRP